MTGQTSAADRLFFDLSTRVKLRVTGADRIRFLNGQITNDIRKASETSAVEACVLNPKGKMEAHIFVHADGDTFLVDADSALAPSLQARLERYIIADDVQIEDVTGRIAIFHTISPEAPNLPVSNRSVSVDRFGIAGIDIWTDVSQSDQVVAALAKQFRACDPQCAERLRIERGSPRWGRELTPEIIPVEANLEHRCIDYEKGCYIGQETISRMKMSGQRNKRLCGLISADGSKLIPETRLLGGPERKDAGWITSATRSGDREIALGYVKRGFNSGQEHLEAGSGETGSVAIRVVELPF